MQLPRPQYDENFSMRMPRAFAPSSLWILFSVLAAYALAIYFPHLRSYCPIFSIGGICIFALVSSFEIFVLPEKSGIATDAFSSRKFFRNIALLSAVAAVGIAYFFWRVPANPYPDFTPREVSISAVLEDVSRGKNGSFYGTAKIVDFAACPKLVGYSIWFVVSDGKGGMKRDLNLQTSALLKFDGAMSPTDSVRYLSRGRSDAKSIAFDEYLAAKFVRYKIFAPSSGVEILAPARPRFAFYAAVAGYMERSLSSFAYGLSADSAPAKTYRAMILGDKSLLSTEQKDAFARTGVMHVFAISGLHVGFAAAILYFALALLRVPWTFRPLAALPVLYIYVCACGGKPSAMRAFGMIAIVWLASIIGRGAKPIDSLILAAIIWLGIFPQDVADAGFALSYCIAASIFVYSLPMFESLADKFEPRILYGDFWVRAFSRMRRKFFDFAVGGLCISLGCSIAAFPLSAHYFDYASLLSAVYSPLFVFCAGIVVTFGFAGFFLPSILTQWLNLCAYAVVWLMDSAATKLNASADVAVDFTIKSGLVAAAAALAFLISSDLLGRFKFKFLSFLLAPAIMLFLILVYKFA